MGADVHLSNEDGHSPLLEAAGGGYEAAIRLLLEHGASVNAQVTSPPHEEGATALWYACQGEHVIAARLLIEKIL